jgi:hypothetical protein
LGYIEGCVLVDLANQLIHCLLTQKNLPKIVKQIIALKMALKLKSKHRCASTCESIDSLVYENVWLSGLSRKKLLLAQTLDWNDQLLNWSKWDSWLGGKKSWHNTWGLVLRGFTRGEYLYLKMLVWLDGWEWINEGWSVFVDMTRVLCLDSL